MRLIQFPLNLFVQWEIDDGGSLTKRVVEFYENYGEMVVVVDHDGEYRVSPDKIIRFFIPE